MHPEVSKTTAAICERPYESRNRELVIITLTTGILTRVAVLLRLASRLWIQHGLGPDDWVIILALITDTVFWVFGIKFEALGFGSHVWDVDLRDIPKLFLYCKDLNESKAKIIIN